MGQSASTSRTTSGDPPPCALVRRSVVRGDPRGVWYCRLGGWRLEHAEFREARDRSWTVRLVVGPQAYTLTVHATIRVSSPLLSGNADVGNVVTWREAGGERAGVVVSVEPLAANPVDATERYVRGPDTQVTGALWRRREFDGTIEREIEGKRVKETVKVRATGVAYHRPVVGARVSLNAHPDVKFGTVAAIGAEFVDVTLDNDSSRLRVENSDENAVCVGCSVLGLDLGTRVVGYAANGGGALFVAVLEKHVVADTFDTRCLEPDWGPMRYAFNTANHAPFRFDTLDDLNSARLRYLDAVSKQFEYVEDAMTGALLKTSTQLLQIGITGLLGDAQQTGGGFLKKGAASNNNNKKRTKSSDLLQPGWRDLQSGAASKIKVAELARRIVQDARSEAPTRATGKRMAQPLLVTARAGSGKTWTVHQLAYFLAQEAESVPGFAPLVVFVNRLVAFCNKGKKDTGDLLKRYVSETYSGDERRLLLQLLDLGSLCIVLDGLDEAAGRAKEMQEYVLAHLAANRGALVVTSRPEAIDAKRFRHFVVCDLAPLTEDEMRRAVDQQLAGNAMFENLCAFSKIRREHDRLYERVFNPSNRRILEGLCFVTESGPCRQRDVSGAELEIRTSLTALKSQFLKRIDSDLKSRGTLDALDSALASFRQQSKQEDACKERVLKIITRLTDAHDAASPARIVTKRLGEHLLEEALRRPSEAASSPKREKHTLDDNTAAAEVWGTIRRRTDALYCAAERVETAAREWLAECAVRSGARLKAAPVFKDPVRVYLKARDDYAQIVTTDPSSLPESMVTDVIRGRLVFEDVNAMCGFARALLEDARLRRFKNKFSPSLVDLAHFRNVLANVEIVDPATGSTHIIEVQLHHAHITNLNDKYDSHAVYEYLRSRLDLADSKQDFETQLEAFMGNFADVCNVPVLLSLLVAVLKQKRRTIKLPADTMELYELATRAVAGSEILLDGIARLAAANMMVHDVLRPAEFTAKRVFSLDFVSKVLPSSRFKAWRERLASETRRVPLIKTLQVGSARETKFQFQHLSFQEALFAKELVQNTATLRKFWKHAATLNAPEYENTFRIAGARLLSRIVGLGKSGALDVPGLDTQGWKILEILAPVDVDGGGGGVSSSSSESGVVPSKKATPKRDDLSLDALTSLDASESPLLEVDLKLAARFHKLKRLSFKNCPKLRGDIGSLARLDDLETLDVSGCAGLKGVLSADAVQVLSRLQERGDARLEGTGPWRLEHQCDTYSKLDAICLSNLRDMLEVDLRALSGLDELKVLSLDGCCKIEGDLSNLLTRSSKKHLRRLSLRGCHLVKGYLKQFSELCSLERLDLSRTRVAGDLSSVRELHRLQSLKLSGCSLIVGTLEPLEDLIHLQTLHLANCPGLDSGTFAPLSGLVELRDLDVSESKIHGTLKFTSKLTRLQRLRIRGCANVTGTLEPLRDVGPSLTELSAAACSQLSGDLDPLSTLRGLVKLDLSRCYGLTGDVQPLQKLAKLTALNLEECIFLDGGALDRACAPDPAEEHNPPIVVRRRKLDRTLHKGDFLPKLRLPATVRDAPAGCVRSPTENDAFVRTGVAVGSFLAFADALDEAAKLPAVLQNRRRHPNINHSSTLHHHAHRRHVRRR